MPHVSTLSKALILFPDSQPGLPKLPPGLFPPRQVCVFLLGWFTAVNPELLPSQGQGHFCPNRLLTKPG